VPLSPDEIMKLPAEVLVLLDAIKDARAVDGDGGTKITRAERRKLRRDFVDVKTPFGTVKVKLGRLDGRVLQAAPEFESCRSVAAMAGVPVKEVFDAARRAPIPGVSPTP